MTDPRTVFTKEFGLRVSLIEFLSFTYFGKFYIQPTKLRMRKLTPPIGRISLSGLGKFKYCPIQKCYYKYYENDIGYLFSHSRSTYDVEYNGRLGPVFGRIEHAEFDE
jgi:hypothetical protein